MTKRIVEPVGDKWLIERCRKLVAEMKRRNKRKTRHHNTPFAHGLMTEGFRR